MPPSKTYLETIIEKIYPSIEEYSREHPDKNIIDSVLQAVIALHEDPSADLLEILREDVTNSALLAAKAYVAILLENEELPAGEQLSAGELSSLRNLLFDYFGVREKIQEKAREVLHIIEEKIHEGAFSQARILLQIFEMEQESRLENERNLFYEEMFLRFGIRRSNMLPESDLDELESRIQKTDFSNIEAVIDFAQWLEDEHFIHFCFFTQDKHNAHIWKKLSDAATNRDDVQQLVSYLPPSRWRSLKEFKGEDDLNISSLVARHITERSLRRHISNITRTCYFLLLTSTDTGYENTLELFLTWLQETLGIKGQVILPRLHRQNVIEEKSLAEVLDIIYNHYFKEVLLSWSDKFEDENLLQNAFKKFGEVMADIDFNQVPPGYYDLGAFIIDELLEFPYESPLLRFKIYRLT